MLVAMALTTLGVISSLVLLQTDVNLGAVNGALYREPEECSNLVVAEIWSSLPKCQARPEMVRLPLPDDPDIVEVIPSHVSVPRCSGVCHQGNLVHKCVAEANGTASTTHSVMLRRHSGAIECSVVQVETHVNCACGCDIKASECSSKQMFDWDFCKCRCNNAAERATCMQQQRDKKFWDEANCQCVCRVEEYRECSTGFVYDPIDTCQCVREQTMSLAGVELVIGLIVVIVVLVAALGGACWKLRRIQRDGQAGRQVEASTAVLTERTSASRGGGENGDGGRAQLSWPEQEPLNQSRA